MILQGYHPFIMFCLCERYMYVVCKHVPEDAIPYSGEILPGSFLANLAFQCYTTFCPDLFLQVKVSILWTSRKMTKLYPHRQKFPTIRYDTDCMHVVY